MALSFFLFALLACSTAVKGAPLLIGSLPNIQHGITGTLYMGQRTTGGQYYFRIENFSYDGGGPDAFVYVYPIGQTATGSNRQGHIIPVSSGADEFAVGQRYTNVLLEVDVPLPLDVTTFQTFTIWCRLAQVLFTKLLIPAGTVNSIVPDDVVGSSSDTMTSSSPSSMIQPSTTSAFTTTDQAPTSTAESSSTQSPAPTETPTPAPGSYQNCEVLSDDLQVSWTLNRSSDSVSVKLCGCIKDSEYMAFGISGSTSTFQMLNADVVVAWHSEASTGAVDYHLSGYAQCRPGVEGGVSAACPDSVQGGVNNAQLVQASLDGNSRCVEYERPATASDAYDKNMNSAAQIVWGMGPRDEASNFAFKHFERILSKKAVSFDRESANNCPELTCRADEVCPWEEEVIDARGRDETFVVRIGQSGALRGYTGITGNSGWGICWYINGAIIPVLNVTRGNTYRFIVYGGNNPSDAGNYHPFYLTDSVRGGRLGNTVAMQASETVTAGIDTSNTPTAVGDLCVYEETIPISGDTSASCSSNFSDYFSTLVEREPCEPMTPGVLEWTPDDSTPDLLYYQCATHAFLGWKIQVEGSAAISASPLLYLTALLTLIAMHMYI